MLGARRGLRRAAFTGQAQRFGPEGGILASTFGGCRAVFQEEGKSRPYSFQIYLTAPVGTVSARRAGNYQRTALGGVHEVKQGAELQQM